MKVQEITQLNLELKQISLDAINGFGDLNYEQLNWKPQLNQWSIGQVFHHLIISNATYFSGFEAIISGKKEITFWERLPFLPKLWGNWLVKSMLPGKGKFKSPKVFRPAQSDIPETIIKDFTVSQDKLIRLIEGLKEFDHEKIIFTSPVAPIITYSLKDTFQILLNHEKRHYQQAIRIKDSSEFPKQ